jgi:hypothetical protein
MGAPANAGASGGSSGFLGMSTASNLGSDAAETEQVSITLESASQAQVTVHPDGTLTATPAPG